MSHARLWLHLGALVAPLAAAALWSLLLYRTDIAKGLSQAAVFGIAGALAAQIAALLRWRALDRRAHEASGGWQTGVGMALITHVLFGVLFDVVLVASVGLSASMGTHRYSDLLLQSLFFAAMSISAVGLITFPTTALFTQKIAAIRRRELANGAA